MTLQVKRHPLALPRTHISSSSRWISYLSAFSVLAILGVLSGSYIIGQIIVMLFGIVAVVMGVKSEEVFKLTMAALGVIVLVSLFQTDILVQHFAVYTFILLCTGLICTIKEQLHSYSDVLIKSSVIQLKPRSYSPAPRGQQVFINRRSRQ